MKEEKARDSALFHGKYTAGLVRITFRKLNARAAREPDSQHRHRVQHVHLNTITSIFVEADPF